MNISNYLTKLKDKTNNISNYLTKLKDKTNNISLIKFACLFTSLLISMILIINKLDMNNNIAKCISISISIIIAVVVIQFFTDEDSYLHEKLDAIEDEDNGFYKSYLDVMIDSLSIANTQIENVKILAEYKNIDLEPYLKKIEGVYVHLQRLSPPAVYKEYHSDILLELETFLTEYSLKIK